MDRSFLAACEREPLQFSGAILAHGTLLVIAPDGRVSHVAANVAEWLDTPAEALLGLPAPENLAAALLMLSPKAGSRLALEAALHAPLGLLDLVASRNEHGAVAVELTRHHPDAQPSYPAPLPETPRDEAELAASRSELVRLIAEMTGFRRVMYYQFREEGDGEVIAALMGKQVDVAIVPVSTGKQQVQTGAIRGLAVTANRRASGLDLATISEQGVSGFDAGGWQALLMPAKSPREAIDRIYLESKKVLASPDVLKQLEGFAVDPVGSTPEEFSTYYKDEVEKFKGIVRDAKIPLQD